MANGGKVKNVVGKAVNSIVECLDVDGIVRRVEINALLDRVDVNALLEEVDIDHHLERIDWNRLLARVDMNAIVARSDLGSIMVQSTTGAFTQVFDALRVQAIVIDLILLRIKQLKKWSDTKGLLPLAPGDPEELDYDECPESRAEKASAVQGRYAGLFSRGLAIFVDCGCLTVSFAIMVLIIQLYLMLFVGNVREDIREMVNKDVVWAIVSREYLWTFILYCIYWYVYFFLSTVLTGRTLGMGLAGIKVVDSQTGLEISGYQAFIRTLLLPLSVTFMPVLIVVGVIRKDGRPVHDIVAGTGVVYRWNARMAGLREKAEKAEEEADVQRRKLERAYRVSVRSIGRPVPAIETRLSEESPKKDQ